MYFEDARSASAENKINVFDFFFPTNILGFLLAYLQSSPSTAEQLKNSSSKALPEPRDSKLSIKQTVMSGIRM